MENKTRKQMKTPVRILLLTVLALAVVASGFGIYFAVTGGFGGPAEPSVDLVQAEADFRAQMADSSVREVTLPVDLVLTSPVEVAGDKVITGEGSLTAAEGLEGKYLITVPDGVSLTLSGDVKIDAAGISGGVYVAVNGNWTLEGNAAVANAAQGTANVMADGKIQMNGGTLSGGYNNVVLNKGAELTWSTGTNSASISSGIVVSEGAKLSIISKDAVLTGSGLYGIDLQGDAVIQDGTLTLSNDTMIKVAETGTLEYKGGTMTEAGYHGIENAGTVNVTGGFINKSYNSGIVNTGKLTVTSGTIMNSANKGIMNKLNGQAMIGGDAMISTNKFAVSNEDNAYMELTSADLMASVTTNVYAYGGELYIHDIELSASGSNNVRVVAATVTMKNVTVAGNTASGSTTTHGILLEGGKVDATDVLIRGTKGNGVRNKGGEFIGKNITVENASNIAVSNRNQDVTDRLGIVTIDNLVVENSRYNNVLTEGGITTITNSVLHQAGTNNIKISDGTLILNNVQVLGNVEGAATNVHGIYMTGGTLQADGLHVEHVSGAAFRVNGETAVVDVKNLTTAQLGMYGVSTSVGAVSFENAVFAPTTSNNLRLDAGSMKLTNVDIQGHHAGSATNVHALYITGGVVTAKDLDITNPTGSGLRNGGGELNVDGLTISGVGTHTLQLTGNGKTNISNAVLGKAKSNNIMFVNGELDMKDVVVEGHVEGSAQNIHGILTGGGKVTGENVTFTGTSGSAIRNKGAELVMKNVTVDNFGGYNAISNALNDDGVTYGSVSIDGLVVTNALADTKNLVVISNDCAGSMSIVNAKLTPNTDTVTAQTNIAVHGGNVTVKDVELGKTFSNNVRVNGGVLNIENVAIPGHVEGSASNVHGLYTPGGEVIAKDLVISGTTGAGLRNAGGKVTIDNFEVSEVGTHSLYISGGETVLNGATIGKTGTNNVAIHDGKVVMNDVEVLGHVETAPGDAHAIFVYGGQLDMNGVAVTGTTGSALRVRDGEVTGKDVVMENIGSSALNISGGKASIDGITTTNVGSNNINMWGGELKVVNAAFCPTKTHNVKVESGTVTVNNSTVNGHVEGVANNLHAFYVTGGAVDVNSVTINDPSGDGLRVGSVSDDAGNTVSEGAITGTDVTINGPGRHGIWVTAGSLSVDGGLVTGLKNNNNNVLVSGGTASLSNMTLDIVNKNNNVCVNGGELELHDMTIHGNNTTDMGCHGLYVNGEGKVTATGYLKLMDPAGAGIRMNDNAVVSATNVTISNAGHYGMRISGNAQLTIDGLDISGTKTNNILQESGTITLKNAVLDETNNNNIKLIGGELNLENVEVLGHVEGSASDVHGVFLEGTGVLNAKDLLVANTTGQALRVKGSEANVDGLVLRNIGADWLVSNTAFGGNPGKLSIKGLGMSAGCDHATQVINTESDGSKLELTDSLLILNDDTIGVVVQGGEAVLDNVKINGGKYAVQNYASVTLNDSSLFKNIWSLRNEAGAKATLNGGYYYGNVEGTLPSDIYNAGELTISDITVGYNKAGKGTSGVIYQAGDASPIVLKGAELGIHTPSKPILLAAEDWVKTWGQRVPIVICDSEDIALDVENSFREGKNDPTLYISQRDNHLELTTQGSSATQPGGNYIVQIGEVRFESFAEAFAYIAENNAFNASGDYKKSATIQVIDSYGHFENVEIPEDYHIILVDDGDALRTITNNTDSHMFTVGDGSKLTIQSTLGTNPATGLVFDGAGKTGAAAIHVNGGIVELKSDLAVANAERAIYLNGGSLAALNGSVLTTESVNYGVYAASGTLNDLHIVSNWGAAVYMADKKAEVVANNLTIEGFTTGIYAIEGKLTVNGLSCEATGNNVLLGTNNASVSSNAVVTINGYTDGSASVLSPAGSNNVGVYYGSTLNLNNVLVEGHREDLTSNIHGIIITGGTVNLDNVTVENTVMAGIRLNAKGSVLNAANTTIQNTGTLGISIGAGVVTLNDGVTIQQTGTHGIQVEGGTTLNIAGAVNVDNVTNNALHISGDMNVSGKLNINNAGGNGVQMGSVSVVTVTGDLVINGAANRGIAVSGGTLNAEKANQVTVIDALGIGLETTGNVTINNLTIDTTLEDAVNAHNIKVMAGSLTLNGTTTLGQSNSQNFLVNGTAMPVVNMNGTVSIQGTDTNNALKIDGGHVNVYGELNIASAAVNAIIIQGKDDTFTGAAGSVVRVSGAKGDSIVVKAGNMVADTVIVEGGYRAAIANSDLVLTETDADGNTVETGRLYGNLTIGNLTVKNWAASGMTAVYHTSGGTTTINGGSINSEDITADSHFFASSVYSAKSVVHADENGQPLENSCVVTLKGVTVGKTSTNNIIASNTGSVALDDVTILGHSVETASSNIYGVLAQGGSVHMTDVTIEGIAAQGSGITTGGIRLNQETSVVTGSNVIINNSVSKGISMGAGLLDVDGMTINGVNDRGISITGGEMSITGLTIDIVNGIGIEQQGGSTVSYLENLSVSSQLSNVNHAHAVKAGNGTMTVNGADIGRSNSNNFRVEAGADVELMGTVSIGGTDTNNSLVIIGNATLAEGAKLNISGARNSGIHYESGAGSFIAEIGSVVNISNCGGNAVSVSRSTEAVPVASFDTLNIDTVAGDAISNKGGSFTANAVTIARGSKKAVSNTYNVVYQMEGTDYVLDENDLKIILGTYAGDVTIEYLVVEDWKVAGQNIIYHTSGGTTTINGGYLNADVDPAADILFYNTVEHVVQQDENKANIEDNGSVVLKDIVSGMTTSNNMRTLSGTIHMYGTVTIQGTTGSSTHGVFVNGGNVELHGALYISDPYDSGIRLSNGTFTAVDEGALISISNTGNSGFALTGGVLTLDGTILESAGITDTFIEFYDWASATKAYISNVLIPKQADYDIEVDNAGYELHLTNVSGVDADGNTVPCVIENVGKLYLAGEILSKIDNDTAIAVNVLDSLTDQTSIELNWTVDVPADGIAVNFVDADGNWNYDAFAACKESNKIVLSDSMYDLYYHKVEDAENSENNLAVALLDPKYVTSETNLGIFLKLAQIKGTKDVIVPIAASFNVANQVDLNDYFDSVTFKPYDDGNYTITYTGSAEGLFIMNDGDKMTIQNLGLAATRAVLLRQDGGELVIEGCTISGTSYNFVQNAGEATIKNTTLNKTSSNNLKVGGTLHLEGDNTIHAHTDRNVNNVHGLWINGGNVDITGTLNIDSALGEGIQVAAGGDLTINGTVNLNGGGRNGVMLNANSTMTVNGELNIANTNGPALNIAGWNAADDKSSVIIANGGKITIGKDSDGNGIANHGVLVQGAGTLDVQSGGELNVSDTTGNGIEQTGGEIKLAGTIEMDTIGGIGYNVTGGGMNTAYDATKDTLTGTLSIQDTTAQAVVFDGAVKVNLKNLTVADVQGNSDGVVSKNGAIVNIEKLMASGMKRAALATNGTGGAVTIHELFVYDQKGSDMTGLWLNSTGTTTINGGKINVAEDGMTVDQKFSNAIYVANGNVAVNNLIIGTTANHAVSFASGTTAMSNVTINATDKNHGVNVGGGTVTLIDVVINHCAGNGVNVSKGATLNGSGITINNARLGLVNYGTVDISDLTIANTTADHSIMNEGNDAKLTINGASIGKSSGRNIALKGGTVTFKGQVTIDANGGSNDAFCFYNSGNTTTLNIYGALTVQNVASDGIEIQNTETDAVVNVYGNFTIKNVTGHGINMPVGTITVHEGGKLNISGITGKDCYGISMGGGELNIHGEAELDMPADTSIGINLTGGELNITGTVSGHGYLINQTGGALSITGATVSGSQKNIVQKGGTAVITDSTFNETASNNLTTEKGTITLNGTVNVKGGTGSSGTHCIWINGGEVTVNGTANLSDTKGAGIRIANGSFTSAVGSVVNIFNANNGIQPNGGTVTINGALNAKDLTGSGINMYTAGTININGTMTVSNTGSHGVAMSAGTINVASGAELTIGDITGSGSHGINQTGGEIKLTGSIEMDTIGGIGYNVTGGGMNSDAAANSLTGTIKVTNANKAATLTGTTDNKINVNEFTVSTTTGDAVQNYGMTLNVGTLTVKKAGRAALTNVNNGDKGGDITIGALYVSDETGTSMSALYLTGNGSTTINGGKINVADESLGMTVNQNFGNAIDLQAGKATLNNVSIGNSNYAVFQSGGELYINGSTLSSVTTNIKLSGSAYAEVDNSTLNQTANNNIQLDGSSKVVVTDTDILGTSASNHAICAQGGDAELTNVNISNAVNAGIRINNANSSVTGKNITITGCSRGIWINNGIVTIDGLTASATTNNIAMDNNSKTDDEGKLAITINGYENGEPSVLNQTKSGNNVSSADPHGVIYLNGVQIKGTDGNGTLHGIMANTGKVELNNVSITDCQNAGFRINGGTIVVNGEVTIDGCGADGMQANGSGNLIVNGVLNIMDVGGTALNIGEWGGKANVEIGKDGQVNIDKDSNGNIVEGYGVHLEAGSTLTVNGGLIVENTGENGVLIADGTLNLAGHVVADIYSEQAKAINVTGALTDGSAVEVDWAAGKQPADLIAVNFADGTMDASKGYITLGDVQSATYLLHFTTEGGKSVGKLVDNVVTTEAELNEYLAAVTANNLSEATILIGDSFAVTAQVAIPDGITTVSIADDGDDTTGNVITYGGSVASIFNWNDCKTLSLNGVTIDGGKKGNVIVPVNTTLKVNNATIANTAGYALESNGAIVAEGNLTVKDAGSWGIVAWSGCTFTTGEDVAVTITGGTYGLVVRSGSDVDLDTLNVSGVSESAIYCEDNTAKLSIDNAVVDGAKMGLNVKSGTVSITDLTISNTSGNGMDLSGGTVTMNNATVDKSNWAVRANASKLTVNGTLTLKNSTYGMVSEANSIVVIEKLVTSGLVNSSIYVNAGNLTINAAEVPANSGDHNVYVANSGTLNLSNATIGANSNSSKHTFYQKKGTVILNNVAVETGADGHAIYHESGSLTIKGDIDSDIYYTAVNTLTVSGALTGNVTVDWAAAPTGNAIKFASADVMNASKASVALGATQSAGYVLSYDETAATASLMAITGTITSDAELQAVLAELAANPATVAYKLTGDIELATARIDVPTGANLTLIADAADGDQITISRGAYTGVMVTVRNGASLTILTADGTVDSRELVFVGTSGQAKILTLEGSAKLTLGQGIEFSGNTHGSNGQAIYAAGTASCTANGIYVANNTGNDGGAIRWDSTGKLVIAGSKFVENTSNTGFGGAISINGGAIVTIDDTIFDGNTSKTGQGGGALILQGGPKVTIRNSTFTNNTATVTTLGTYGGGAIKHNSGSLTVEDCHFEGNSAVSGGAIMNQSADAPLTIKNCVFLNNTATAMGGAVRQRSAAALYISGSEFEGNKTTTTSTSGSDHGGAAVFVQSSPAALEIKECEFVSNTAGTYGGAIKMNSLKSGVTGYFTDCTFISNSAMNGGAMYIQGGDAYEGTNLEFYKNSATDIGGAIWSNKKLTLTDPVFGEGEDANTATNGNADYYATNIKIDYTTIE